MSTNTTTTTTTISVSSTTTTDGRLPLLTLEEIRLKLVTLLRDAADLSAYIQAVDEGRIIVMNRSLDLAMLQPGCSGTPKPTILGEPVRVDRLERVGYALLAANAAFTAGKPLQIEASKAPSSCVGPDGKRLS